MIKQIIFSCITLVSVIVLSSCNNGSAATVSESQLSILEQCVKS